MGLHFTGGAVIFRHWDRRTGLAELSRPFNNLDELLDLCTHVGSDYLVDRILIDGEDAAGTLRTLTLVFQSSTRDLDADPSSAHTPPGSPR